jgi:hypothetical protein
VPDEYIASDCKVSPHGETLMQAGQLETGHLQTELMITLPVDLTQVEAQCTCMPGKELAGTHIKYIPSCTLSRFSQRNS